MSTITIRDLPEDRTLDREAMQALQGGYSFASRFQPNVAISKFYPPHPIYPSDPVLPTYTTSG